MQFDLDKFFKECMDISNVKGKGYTGDKAPCFNFVITELLTGIPAWKAVTVRLLDKMCRNVSFMTTASVVPDDPFKDCCRDTANYAGIQRWLYEHRKDLTAFCTEFRVQLCHVGQGLTEPEE